MASMTVLAASGIGLVAAPMAFGQILIPLGSSQSTGVTNPTTRLRDAWPWPP